MSEKDKPNLNSVAVSGDAVAVNLDLRLVDPDSRFAKYVPDGFAGYTAPTGSLVLLDPQQFLTYQNHKIGLLQAEAYFGVDRSFLELIEEAFDEIDAEVEAEHDRIHREENRCNSGELQYFEFMVRVRDRMIQKAGPLLTIPQLLALSHTLATTEARKRGYDDAMNDLAGRNVGQGIMAQMQGLSGGTVLTDPRDILRNKRTSGGSFNPPKGEA